MTEKRRAHNIIGIGFILFQLTGFSIGQFFDYKSQQHVGRAPLVLFVSYFRPSKLVRVSLRNSRTNSVT